jgi:iron complex transport system substrate-binding protein
VSKKATWAVVAATVALGVVLAATLSRVAAPRQAATSDAPGGAPRRVVAMAPNIVETIYALGAGESVVGVSDYTAYPLEAKAKPCVGALFNPDLERITALKPDLVVVQDHHARVEELCRTRGIGLMRVNMARVDSIIDGVALLGRRLGREARAQEIVAGIRHDLDVARARVAGKPRVKVLICVDRTPGTLKNLFTVGRNSFLAEMVEIAGGENLFNDVERDYFEPSAEEIVMRKPEVVIEMRPGQFTDAESQRKLVSDWNALSTLPAVRDKRVHVLTEDFIVVPGPRVGLIAERLAAVVHPD